MHRLRKTGLALAIGAAFTSYAALATVTTDIQRADTVVHNELGQATYIINLVEHAAFTKNQQERMKNVAATKSQQAEIISLLRQLDANLVVHGQVSLVGNAINLSVTPKAIATLKGNTAISSIVQVAKHTKHSPKRSPAMSTDSGHYVSVKANAATQSGSGVKVAVIGTGVDYTHTSLGGDGTLDSYIAAWTNASNDYSEFPTATVVDGRDFSSESGWGVDANPIDTALEYQRDYGDFAVYPTGQGTKMASIVMENAPSAQIVAVKIANLSENDWGGMNFALPSTYTLESAVEWMIDPNADGDFSDRVADVVVLEAMGSGFAIFDNDTLGTDPINLHQKYLQYLSAADMLVVTDTGGMPLGTSKYNLGYGSATPEVLGVNPIQKTEDGTYVTTEMTAHGPVRMNEEVIKPDLAAVTNASAAMVGSGSENVAVGNSYVSAATVAGQPQQ